MPFALLQDRYGEPRDVLRLAEVSEEAPGHGEIVIRMEAAAMHIADLRTVQGAAGFSFPLPRTPGFEGIGRVVRVGPGAGAWRVGDRAFPPSGCGTFRQEVRVSAEAAMPAPDGDACQLALVTINGPTAYVLLHDFAKLEPGDWILQNAANSSCGRYVVALAHEAGVRTVNVVRRPELIAELQELGADVVLLDGEDLPERVLAATGGVRPKLGLDAVAGDATHRISLCIAPGSTVVCYGAMSGRRCEMDFYQMFRNDLSLVGMSFRRTLERRSRDEIRAIYAALAARMADGRLAARIAAAYPLARWRDAFDQASRTGRERDGKVILLP
jgi:NADPH:quinone reductase-like Zn-dependent oxidoreductase